MIKIEKLNLEEVDNPGEATLKAFSILNQLVDAVNNQQIQLNNHECRLLDLQNQINEHDQEIDDCAVTISKMEKYETSAENVQDRMIGCTTLDIPESYIKSCRMEKEFAEEECKRLQGELERTRKALGMAKSKLNGIHRLYSKAFYTREDWLQVCIEMVDKANNALEQITALEQKDK